jgi:tetratricopeptide (TPR) repeat protein
VHYYAGRAAERLGDWSRALDAYRSSIRSGAGATDAGVKLARLNLALGKYRDAFVAAGHHVNEHGPEPEAVLLALEASTRLSRPEFNVSLSKVREGEFGEVGVLLARVANELRGAEAAVAQLHDIERLDLENPRDVAALDALAHYLVEAGRVGEARERVDAMLAQHPDLARLHLIRSRLSSGEAATRALERAFELDAELEMVAVAMAMRRAEKGEVDAGVALIEPFVKSNPLRLIDIADLLARAGRNQEAEARLEDLLWERPHHSEAATRLVALRLSRGAGQEPRTLELAERAVKFLGGAPAYQALADVHDARGDAEKAKEARDKASTSS